MLGAQCLKDCYELNEVIIKSLQIHIEHYALSISFHIENRLVKIIQKLPTNDEEFADVILHERIFSGFYRSFRLILLLQRNSYALNN